MTESDRPTVRICAYPAEWLLDADGFAKSDEIIWSTSPRTKPDDIQVFAVSTTLGDAEELALDARRDAVHSIWQAASEPLPEYAENYWPVQARFVVRLRLTNPVPKADLIAAGLIKRNWPQHWQGFILHTQQKVQTLAKVLARRNPEQALAIADALNV